MRRFITLGPAVVVLAVCLLATIVMPAAIRSLALADTRARVVLARQTLDGPDNILERIDEAVRNVAVSVEPSVVHIEVETAGFASQGSSGSGWVYDSLGHIVTNAHVVADADTIRVEFHDGYLASAELLAADAHTDIAVLKISPHQGLIPSARATGKRVSKGDRVFTFGSPFGFKFSMTEGIVSGLGRSPRTAGGGIIRTNAFSNFIQTDAAVNPGNSGGPVVDVNARVVGMSVAIATGRQSESIEDRSSQSAGISFAIPLGVIESVVDQLIETGSVRRGFLGIGNFIDAPMEAAGRHLGRGVLVGNVVPENAADRAGIRRGDIIARINNEPVSNREQLRSEISTANPGEALVLTVFREGRFLDLPVQLDEFPVEDIEGRPIGNALGRFGVELGETRSGPKRVVVLGVRRESLAQSAGFAHGQRVTAVEGEPVRSLLDLYGVLGSSNLLVGQPVVFTVIDAEGQEQDITVRVRR